MRDLQFTSSGRNDEFQRTSPGIFTAVCDNRSDAVTGLGLKKAQWMRVQAQWQGVTYSLWQGIIEAITRRWPGSGRDATVTIQAADVLKILRIFDMGGQTFPSQRCDQRIAAIAALAGITTGSIDTDTDMADAVTTAYGAGTDGLTVALDIELSENGLLIADPAGTLSFQGRHWRLIHASTSLATFGESGGEIPYSDSVAYQDDDSRLANIVNVTPYGATSPITVEDATSENTYWKRSNQSVDRTLVTSDTTIATSCAQYLLSKYKDPSPRLPAITIALGEVAKQSASLVTTLLELANSQRFTWTRADASPISEDVYVEQISHSISPEKLWSITLQLSPADATTGWVLGDATNSVLGSTTVLVY